MKELLWRILVWGVGGTASVCIVLTIAVVLISFVQWVAGCK